MDPPLLPPEVRQYRPLLAPAYDLLPLHVWTVWVCAVAALVGIPVILWMRGRRGGPAASERTGSLPLLTLVCAGAFLPLAAVL
jgi:hypothetical protein